MKITHRGFNSDKPWKGLTVVELLVVLALIAIFVSLIPATFSFSKVKAIRIKCLNNVKQISLGVVSYAVDHHDQLPSVPDGTDHLPWDLRWGPSEQLQSNGLNRDIMYCPAFPQQNLDLLWNASTNQYRTIGYALALSGPGSTLIASNQNFALANSRDNSARILVADPTISLTGQNDASMASKYEWIRIPGGPTDRTKTPYGPWHGYSTSHVDKSNRFPLGGNAGFLDGHAKWRPFSEMQPRTTGTNNTPIFWW